MWKYHMKTNIGIHVIPLICLIYGMISHNPLFIVIGGLLSVTWYVITCVIVLYFMEEMYDRYSESSPAIVRRPPVKTSELQLQF